MSKNKRKPIEPRQAVGRIGRGDRNWFPVFDSRRIAAATTTAIAPAKSANAATMTFDAIVASDRPVIRIDDDGYSLIDEVLHGPGGRFPSVVPLLDSHARYSIQDQLGAVTGFKRFGGDWHGKAELTQGVAEAEAAGRKIEAGHLTDLSIGYRVSKRQAIAAGKSATIEGVRYSATALPLWVATVWEVYEVSLCPIGADQTAKIRHRKSLTLDVTPTWLPKFEPVRIA